MGKQITHIRHEPSYKQLEIYTNGGDGRQCYQETTQRATSLKNGQKKNIKRQTMIYKQLHSKLRSNKYICQAQVISSLLSFQFIA